MRHAVPAHIGIRIAQPEIGRAIHNLGRERGKLFDSAGRLAMRQRQKQQIARLDAAGRHELQGCMAAQIRMRAGEGLAGQALGCDLRQLDIGVEQQQPRQLAADVAACPDDAYSYAHRYPLLRVRG